MRRASFGCAPLVLGITGLGIRPFKQPSEPSTALGATRRSDFSRCGPDGSACFVAVAYRVRVRPARKRDRAGLQPCNGRASCLLIAVLRVGDGLFRLRRPTAGWAVFASRSWRIVAPVSNSFCRRESWLAERTLFLPSVGVESGSVSSRTAACIADRVRMRRGSDRRLVKAAQALAWRSSCSPARNAQRPPDARVARQLDVLFHKPDRLAASHTGALQSMLGA